MIYTSLNEIKSFNPCPDGWEDILSGQGKTFPDDVLFPLTDALESNSFSDVCWLLGRKKKEISVAVKAAKMCAESVVHLSNKYVANAAAYAAAYADAAAAAAAYAANAANAADAAAAAAYAAYAAYAANAAANAAAYADANAAADADAADAAAANADAVQKEKNKQFLKQCIEEWKE